LVNGVRPQQYSFANGVLTIVMPMDIAASGSVVLSISATDDGIGNAEIPQVAEVSVRTSRDRRGVVAGRVNFANIITVTVSISPPLPAGTTAYMQEPLVTLEASEGSVVSYHLDDGQATAYSGAAIRIPEGYHTLSVYAVGSAPGLRSDTTRYSFTVDTKPPAIVLDNAGMAFKSSGGLVEVSGVASEPLSELQLAGALALVGADLRFSLTLALRDGDILPWTARDVAGNVASGVIDVDIDDVAPSVSVLSPVEGSRITDQQWLEIRCSIGEDGTVRINEVEARLDSGVWVATVEEIAVTRRTRRTCVLVLGSDTALLNGGEVPMGVTPMLLDGTVMVPVRFLSELLGATVEWSPAFQLVTLRLRERSAQLQIGSSITLIDGRVGPMLQQAPLVVTGRTMVPLRFISEVFGASVSWEPTTRTVTIELPNR
jgi:hypothetical protein